MNLTQNLYNPWVPYRWKCQRPSLRLFCLPYAGGSASIFYRWREFLPNNIELCAIQLPGRGKRIAETPCRNFYDLIHDLSMGIAEYLDTPFAFFGHSLGALISFELAHLLESQNKVSGLVIASASLTPAEVASKRRNPSIDQLSDEELCAKLQRLGGTPEEILRDHEAMATILPVLRGDFALLDNYLPKMHHPLQSSITVFGGSMDSEAPLVKLRSWKEYTVQPLRIKQFEGGHFFLNFQLEKVIKSILEELQIKFFFN